MVQTKEGKTYLIREACEEDYRRYFAEEVPEHRVCLDGDLFFTD